jgi:hypothetical protein
MGIHVCSCRDRARPGTRDYQPRQLLPGWYCHHSTLCCWPVPHMQCSWKATLHRGISYTQRKRERETHTHTIWPGGSVSPNRQYYLRHFSDGGLQEGERSIRHFFVCERACAPARLYVLISLCLPPPSLLHPSPPLISWKSGDKNSSRLRARAFVLGLGRLWTTRSTSNRSRYYVVSRGAAHVRYKQTAACGMLGFQFIWTRRSAPSHC